MILLQPSANFREQRRFEQFARDLVRLPGPEEEPGAHLLPEAHWAELLSRVEDQDAWLMGLSQATGVYFFPSREWVARLMRYLTLLKVQRLLEAGAGRGYLAVALAPQAEAAGLEFKAIDQGDGEFAAGLDIYLRVEPGDVFRVIRDFRPDAVLYAWPPPGQSLAEICRAPFVRYLIVVGERGGGATGAREDWENLPHRMSPALTRFGRGRTGVRRHAVTIFYGKGA
jgi:hypothetical protein